MKNRVNEWHRIFILKKHLEYIMQVNAEQFDVQALIKSCCATVSSLLEERPNVVLNYSVANGVGQAYTDQGRVRQMMINLRICQKLDAFFSFFRNK